MADVVETLADGADARSGLSLAALRDDGIAMLQRLAGEVWTDYNLHDPGVTALEQLVYALADLAYRTGFDMADYLTGPDGRIDYEALALYPPQAILSSEALTLQDYRRLIYDAIPQLDEIWIRPLGGGLMSIDVMVDDAAPDAPAAPLALQVRQVVCAHRGLAEDLHEVRVVTPRPYYLAGEIDTSGERGAADILAHILFECGQYLSSGMAVRRLRDVVAEGRPPSAVFEGPATRHGYVEARADAAGLRTVTISELIGVIQRIPGVHRIRTLSFVDADGKPCHEVVCDSASGSYPTLPFPAGDAVAELLRLAPVQGIEYGVSEQVVPASEDWRGANRMMVEEARLELHKLRFERRAYRIEDNRGQDAYPLPEGQRRDLRAYYSVQNEFPAVYGVGEFGMPHSASAQRKAQAGQLKGYLFPFEQLMANYLENLQAIPTLFSAVPDQPARSYFTQYLGGRTIPRIEELYGGDPDTIRTRLAEALARQDDYAERKGRLYDYLLALYGEAFPQATLRRFNHYHREDVDGWLLEAKRRLLVELVDLSAGRGRGFDYLADPADGVSVAPLARRVAILLGCDEADGRSLLPRRDGRA
ncbi:MAG: hypothetical protein ACLGI6_22510, partial [Gammaproteobacteria bacterium]